MSPHKKVLALSTTHFEILYYAEQQDLADLYAKQFEKAWDFLGGIYLSRPEDKVVVVLNDSIDAANGFSTRIPYPYIMLYPVLPDLDDSISEFETWSLELAVHELAHVHQFEPANGVVRTLRHIFGSIIAPNLLLPTWWKEGSSVWAETAISKKGGRLRSTYQEATLRSWVGFKDFRDFTIAQANEDLPDWPWGSHPYVFGSLTMCYIIQKHGEEVLKKMAEGHGGTVPYFYDRVTEPLTNQSYREIYEEGMQVWEQRARDQIQTLSAVKLDEPTEVTTPDKMDRSPTFSADGKFLAWVGQDRRADARLKLVELDAKRNMGPIQELAKGDIQDARFFPKSNRILYNEMKPASQSEYYSDLFIYDLEQKKKIRLTKKLRGRDAQVSPSENEAVFVGIEGGRTALRTIDLETKNINTLFTSQLDERIASPLYLNDSQILYSFLQNGKESLYVWDRSTQKSTLYNAQGNRLRRPLRVGSDLWVMSDLNRVFNLYKLNGANLSNPLTHVKTTIIDYAVDPKSGSVYAIMMTPTGPKLSYLPAETIGKNVKSLPYVEPMMGKITSLPDAVDVDPHAESEDRPYKLWPHYWIPYISGSSASKGVLLSVSTSGSDPTLQHSYDVGLLYDTGINEFSYNADYVNRTMSWPWAVESARAARNFANSTDVYYNQAHVFTLMPDTMKISDYWATSLSFVYTKYEDQVVTYERSGPRVSFAFSNAKQTLWMISPEEGGEASLAYTRFGNSPHTENLPDYGQYLAKGAYYFSHWLPEAHVISLEARALITDEKVPSALGDASTEYASPLTSTFLSRGYFEGQFRGYNIFNANLEYRFPIWSYATWHGLFPFFIKRIHGAAVVDAISVDGEAYDQKYDRYVPANTGQVFSSAGAEVRIDTTVGYVIPFQFVFGLHQPFQPEYNRNPVFYMQVRSGLGF
jgi:hypothetical protein